MEEITAQAIRKLLELPADEKRIGEGVGHATISDAERRLGCQFPKPYTLFLRTVGWGGADGTEIYGLSDRLRADQYPDVVDVNLKARSEDGLPDNLIAFETTGDGGYYVMDADADADGAVLVWYPWGEVEADDLERSDESFGEWLLRAVADAISLRDL
jgi:SMI1 / KNR4 family.